MPVFSIKSSAALIAINEVPLSLSFKMRRSLMPVRVVIHSSLVSTIVSNILLDNTNSGTYLPTPVMAAVIFVIGLKLNVQKRVENYEKNSNNLTFYLKMMFCYTFEPVLK